MVNPPAGNRDRPFGSGVTRQLAMISLAKIGRRKYRYPPVFRPVAATHWAVCPGHLRRWPALWCRG